MIHIDDLQVSYGAVRAVDHLSLHVPRGSLFGLLGPNGAGKTTTIRCIAGLVQPGGGRITVDGLDAVASSHAVRGRVGVVPQALALYDELSVTDNLRVFGGAHGLRGALLAERVEKALELARLEARPSARVGTLSGGMKRRLNLACSLLHDPQVIICDEPTTGVDPQSRNHIFETIRQLHRSGRTVVYTTHYMEEVEELCDRVAIIDHGRVVACNSLAVLLARDGDPVRHTVTLSEGQDSAALNARLQALGLPVESVTPTPQSLEDLFLELTGHSLRDDA